MGRQLLKNNQVTGVDNPTLQEDLVNILSKTKYYNEPVNTKADLPPSNNVDGEIRLVMDEDALYVWHAPVNGWRSKTNLSTERRMTNVLILADDQTNFATAINVGVADGIADLKSIILIVNGLTQYPDTDFTVSVDSQVPPKLQIAWTSHDFKLEKDDMVAILYDILRLR